MTQLVPPRTNRLRLSLPAVACLAAALWVTAPWALAAEVSAERSVTAARQMLDEQQHLAALEQSVGQLRSDAQVSQRAISDLQARLDEAVTLRPGAAALYPLSWVAALLTLTTLMLVGLLWRETRQRNLPWWLAPQYAAGGASSSAVVARPPVPACDAAAALDSALPVPYANATPELEAAVDAAAMAMTPAMTPATTLAPPLPPFQLSAASGALPEPVWRRSSDAAEAELSVQTLTDLAQQADFFVALGQDDAAVELLMGLVRSDAESGAMPYLKLLKIYRRRGDRDAYERIRDRFNRRFNVSAPAWGAAVAVDSQIGQLTDQPVDPIRVVNPVDIDLLLPFGVQRALISASDFAPWVTSTDIDIDVDLSVPAAFAASGSSQKGSAAFKSTFTAKSRDHSSASFDR